MDEDNHTLDTLPNVSHVFRNVLILGALALIFIMIGVTLLAEVQAK